MVNIHNNNNKRDKTDITIKIQNDEKTHNNNNQTQDKIKHIMKYIIFIMIKNTREGSRFGLDL